MDASVWIISRFVDCRRYHHLSSDERQRHEEHIEDDTKAYDTWLKSGVPCGDGSARPSLCSLLMNVAGKGLVRPSSKIKYKQGTGVADDLAWHIMNGLSPGAQVDALVRHILEGHEDQLEEDSYATIIDVITYGLRTVERFGRPEEHFAELVELNR
jgi:hypothetical protein